MKAEGFRDPALELEWARRCQGRVAFLRHKIPSLEHRDSSDWDVAVRDLEGVGKNTEELLGCPLVKASRVYVEQRYYRWGQLDLLPSFEWNGFVYLEEERFWDGVSVGGDGLPRPRISHDAFVAWMTGLLTGGSYNHRYHELLVEAWRSDREEFESCLDRAFGVDLAEEMVGFLEGGVPGEAVGLVDDLRSALKGRAFYRSPGATLERVIRHWSRELFLHWKPPFPWVAFLGPDGVGKSTVIHGFESLLSTTRLKTLLVHWRPKSSGHEPADAVPVTDPHGQSPRGYFFSTMALMLLGVRWAVGRLGRTWHQRSKQKILVSDRYYPDLLVDPRRYRYGGSKRLAQWAFRFFPKPDLTIILHARPEVILGRKEEVSPGELTRQLKEYRALAASLPNKVFLVDTGKKMEEVMDEVERVIFEHLFLISQ